MRDGLIVADMTGLIGYANPAIAEMLGIGQSEICGHSFFSFMSAEQAAVLRNSLLPQLCSEKQLNSEVELIDTNGRQFLADINLTQTSNQLNVPVNLVLNIRDATSKKRLENQLRVLNRFTTDLAQIHDPAAQLDQILSVCEDLFEADASGILLSKPVLGTGSFVHVHQLIETDYRTLVDIIETQNQALDANENILIIPGTKLSKDFENDTLRLIHTQGYQALILVILGDQSPISGKLGLFYRLPQKFDQNLHQLGLVTAQILSVILQNIYLNQSEHDLRQYADGVVQATIALNNSLDIDLVLNQILEQTFRVVPCDSVNLMLVEGDHASVVQMLHSSPEGGIESIGAGPVLPLTTPTFSRMVTTGQPMMIPDTQEDPDWKTLASSSWIRSYASAPLQVRQQVIGFLNVNSRKPHFFNDESIHRLQAFASQAAAALNNARLYGDLQKYSFELEDRVAERTIQLSQAKNRIEAILESVPDAVFVLDSNEKLLESNQAGKSLIVQIENAQELLFNPDLMNHLKSGGQPDEKAIVEVSGRIYQALSSSLSLADQQADQVIVFRDVTRFQELDQMKTQFVSDVSHELRTPLANLSLFLDLLSNEPITTKREKYHATLRRETNRLTELIEDLLTISRLESNRLNIYLNEMDLVPMINDLVEDRSLMAKQHNLELNFAHPGKKLIAMVDPRMLNQVLSNILTNAINYTPSGGNIRLEACEVLEDGTTWVEISVADDGYGIDESELPHIFTRFFRGAASRMTSAPGTGLGLAISSEIIKRMNGQITVETTKGAGSKFTVRVPSVL